MDEKRNTMIGTSTTFSPAKTFFTADTHFSHARMIDYSGRPFGSAEEMNEVLIRNWNKAVPKDGTMFHLGDFCFGDSGEWNGVLDRLKGRIYLVLGNHDLRVVNRQFMARFAGVVHEMCIKVGAQSLILNHYPLLAFAGQEEWNWQLFGHIHTNPHRDKALSGERMGLLRPTQYDVGTDNNGFRPVSFGEIAGIIAWQTETGRRYRMWENKAAGR